MSQTMTHLTAEKVPGYVLEPLLDGPTSGWEGFIATNPSVIRISGDPRVFLGYRASGQDEHFINGEWGSIWGSLLGMAILDERGEKVVHRLPLPLMKIERDAPLPQSYEEFDAYQAAHGEKMAVLHDFRLSEYDGWIHVVYHEGSLTEVHDCIVRMTVAGFLDRIERSINLAAHPIDEISGEWRSLWWAPGVWEPCGVDGTNRMFASRIQKGDNVFLRLADGTMELNHRPCPDYGALNVGKDFFAKATPDGITTYGVLENCVRPGYFDNSHAGPNGNPIPAWIGNVPVYIDIVHGVHNEMISNPEVGTMSLTYLPYLRVKDRRNGEVLYYSENPIADIDETWYEYAVEGAWIRILPHIKGVLFAGGQIPVVEGREGLDDEFSFYTGVGDTATARATFRLRDLIPPDVIDDILVREEHMAVTVDQWPDAVHQFPEPLCGWDWKITNNGERRRIEIHRSLEFPGGLETACRPILGIPGNFDADGVSFDGSSIRLEEGLGWVLVYKGIRWDVRDGEKVTSIGYGVMILAEENPEKVFYRSKMPIFDRVGTVRGWESASEWSEESELLDSALDAVPEKVLFETRRLLELLKEDKGMPSQMSKWLRQKSARAAELKKKA